MQFDCNGCTNIVVTNLLKTKFQPKYGVLVQNDDDNIRNTITTCTLEVYFKHLQIIYQYIYEAFSPLCSASVQSSETTNMFDLFGSRYAEVL